MAAMLSLSVSTRNMRAMRIKLNATNLRQTIHEIGKILSLSFQRQKYLKNIRILSLLIFQLNKKKKKKDHSPNFLTKLTNYYITFGRICRRSFSGHLARPPF